MTEYRPAANRTAVCVALAAIVQSFSAASAFYDLPTAVYDPTTGGVTFQGLEGHLGLRIDSREGNLLAQATDLAGQATGQFGLVNESAAPDFVEWGNIVDGLTGDNLFGGHVVAPGTPVEDLWFQFATPDAGIYDGTILWHDPATGDLTPFHSTRFEPEVIEPPVVTQPQLPPPAPAPTPPAPVDPLPTSETITPVSSPSYDPDFLAQLVEPVAVYDPVSGGVTFQGLEGHLGLRIDSQQGNLLPQATDLAGRAGGQFGVVNQSAAPDFLEWGNLEGMHFDIGFGGYVVQPGTDVADLRFQYALPDASIHDGTILWPDPSTGELLAYQSMPFGPAQTEPEILEPPVVPQPPTPEPPVETPAPETTAPEEAPPTEETPPVLNIDDLVVTGVWIPNPTGGLGGAIFEELEGEPVTLRIVEFEYDPELINIHDLEGIRLKTYETDGPFGLSPYITTGVTLIDVVAYDAPAFTTHAYNRFVGEPEASTNIPEPSALAIVVLLLGAGSRRAWHRA